MIEYTCANPNAEDAGANFLQISAQLGDLQVPEIDSAEVDRKVQNYIETVCGWEKSQHIPDFKDVSGKTIANPAYGRYNPKMLEVIQDIQENSKDWRCKYRIFLAKILKSTIFDLLNTSKESSQKSLDLKYV